MSVELSMDSSSQYDRPIGYEDLESPIDMTPCSTSRRTRTRVPQHTPAGISDTDFSDEEDSPRNRKLGVKKNGKGQILRDDSGRPLTPAEARRHRKRITNRESARRMRLLRKEEWNKLQQEVHDKTIELQKVHNMNRQLNEGYSQLEIKYQALQSNNQAISDEVMTLVRHMRESLGKEVDNRHLASFLRQMAQLLPPQATHQVMPSTSLAWAVDGLHKSPVFDGTKAPSQIHVHAHGGSGPIGYDSGPRSAYDTGARPAYDAAGRMKRSFSAPDPEPCMLEKPPKKQRISCTPLGGPESCSGGLPPLHPEPAAVQLSVPPQRSHDDAVHGSPAEHDPMSQGALATILQPKLEMVSQQPLGPITRQHLGPSRTGGGMISEDFSLMAPINNINVNITAEIQPGSLLDGETVSLEPINLDLGNLGRFTSEDAKMFAAFSSEVGLDKQLSIGKLLDFDLEEGS